MLALGVELERRDGPVGARGREHDELGRPCRQIDRHIARDEMFGLVHECVPRADDLVHGAIVSVP